MQIPLKWKIKYLNKNKKYKKPLCFGKYFKKIPHLAPLYEMNSKFLVDRFPPIRIEWVNHNVHNHKILTKT